MRDLRVLVVDDSAYNRRTISDLLTKVRGVEVVGKASDGDEALRMANELTPDLITLDLEMPRMDGFTFLRLLMARTPTPVIVVSGYSAKENVFRALELGAIDFVSKPTRTVTSDLSAIGKELAEKVAMVRQLSPAGLSLERRPLRSASTAFSAVKAAEMRRPTPAAPRKLVVIGASTGGPTALVEIFRRMPATTPAAIVVAQHMPERFTKTFAERLDRLGGLAVKEVTRRTTLEAGTAWICPGGRCVEVLRTATGYALDVVSPRPEDRYIPSVDRLFETAAAAAGRRVVGVVLTGMGDDGAKGVSAIKGLGGEVYAEAPETAVIYGMPGAAVRTGHVDHSLPLLTLGDKIAELLT